ncbi:MAG: copper resistance protein CopC [Chloroflexi bacterium]|nr:copper resistance protein CopC [Chloroflexota bacterium]
MTLRRLTQAPAHRWALAVALAAVLIGVGLMPVGAHANLVRAIPAAGSTVETPPQVVAAEFSERIEPGFSRIDVLDASGASVTDGPSQVDPSNRSAMLVRVPPLADGTYVVTWRTLSVVDGHVIRGSYAFSVGEPIDADVASTPASALILSPAEPVLRAALLVGVMLVLGTAVHVPLTFAPAARAVGVGSAGSRYVELGWIGLSLAAGAHVGLLVTQAAGLAGDAEADLVGAVGSALGLGQWGTLWIARAIAFVALALALMRAGREPRPLGAWLPVAAVAAAVLVTVSLGSHAAALLESSAAATSADVLHLLTAALWAGGLAPLLLSLAHARRTLDDHPRRRLMGALLARFSTIATISVGALVITGAFATWIQVVELPRLAQTDYGRALVAKLALVAPLIGLGAVNLLWTRRRLSDSRPSAAGRWAPRLVAAEVLLGVAVVVVVGLLTSLEPARQVALGDARGVNLETRVDDLDVSLSIQPGAPGNNTAALTLQDRGQPVVDADVELHVKFLDSDIGQRDLRPTPDADGRYIVAGDFIGLVGRWQALAIVRRPGEFDARAPFRFDVTPGGSAAGGAPPPAADDVRRVWAIALAGLGLLLAFAMLQPMAWADWARRGVTVAGFGAGAVGLALLVTTPEFAPSSLSAVNPVPPDQTSIDAGRVHFEAHCVSCHGPGGQGDGPLAAGLDPPPLDLTIHVPLHPDGELYGFIESGIADTAMPAFGETLTVFDIWNLVNYLQTLPP